MITAQEILDQIRNKQVDQAETNIKYCNSIYERRNKKEVKEVSVSSDSKTNSETTATPSLVSSLCSFASPLVSPKGDIASLVSLQDGTTSIAFAQEVVKANPTENSGPEVHYAKVTTRRPVKNTRRRKINLDFNVNGSNKMNKLTFATTHKFWEWNRDIKADYESNILSEQEWAWYQNVANDYKKVKEHNPHATIGKGCQRGNSKAMKQTACIYTGTEVAVYIGNWQHNFELEAIMSGPASVHHDSMAEFRSNRTGYTELEWE